MDEKNSKCLLIFAIVAAYVKYFTKRQRIAKHNARH